jgi:hypothetical protein
MCVKKVNLYLHFNWATRLGNVLGSGGIAPRILVLGTRWRWVVSFTPRPLYPEGKRPCFSLEKRLGGPQSRSGRGGEEKNSHPPPGIEPWNSDHPARSPTLCQVNIRIFRRVFATWQRCLQELLIFIKPAFNLLMFCVIRLSQDT